MTATGAADLAGKVALVTGASRGIGRASAEALARMGAAVAVNYREDKEGAEETCSLVRAAGGTAIAVRADVASDEDVESMFDALRSELGDADVLVANAGLTRDRIVALMGEEDWQRVLDVNLTGAYRCVKRVLRPMMRKRWGRIVTIASIAGLHGNIGQANYCAAKAGLIGMTRAVAREVAARGITANAVAPGYVDTAILGSMPAKMLEAATAHVPLGRFGTAEEVAHAVAFLASPAASYVTGQVLVIDGGMSS